MKNVLRLIIGISLMIVFPDSSCAQLTKEDLMQVLKDLDASFAKRNVEFITNSKIKAFSQGSRKFKNVRKLWKDIKENPGNTVEEDIKVKAVNFSVHNGTIHQIEVIAEDNGGNEQKYYRDLPISMLRWNAYLSSIIPHATNSSKFLILKDVLNYSNSFGYHIVPVNQAISITPEKVFQANTNKSIDQEINLSVFTDFLGLFGDESNGILDVELSSNFILNPRYVSFRNHSFLKSIKPFIKYTRLDNTVDTLIINHGDTISTRAPSQKAFMNFGGTIDLFYTDLWNLHEFAFVTGYRGMLTKYLSDSNAEGVEEIMLLNEIILPGSFDLTINSFNNFKAKFSSYINYGALNINGVDASLGNRLSVRYNFDLSYSSQGDGKNQLFTRVHFYHELNKSKEFFYNFQIGGRFNLNKLFELDKINENKI